MIDFFTLLMLFSILEQRGRFMKRDGAFLFFTVSFLLFVPGCGRLIDWGKTQVEQGQDIKENLKPAKNYIRSTRTYDQFTLVGAFDSLWLSDEVRLIYSNLYQMKHGRTDEERNIFLRRQLEENNHFITFYLLSACDITIGQKDSDWTVMLRIGNYNFVPTEFKTVDLSPEYKAIFGKHFNRFKTAYILQFNAKDIEDTPLISPETKEIELLFRSVEKQVMHNWRLDGPNKLLA